MLRKLGNKGLFVLLIVAAFAAGLVLSSAVAASISAAQITSGSTIKAASGAQKVILPDFSDLVEELKPSVVNIFTTKIVSGSPFQPFELPFGREDPFRDFFKYFFKDVPMKQRSLGSGFIIDPSGYILTNNHVVENAEEIKVKLYNEKEYDATIVGKDPATDIALIKVNTKDKLPAARLGDSGKLKVGQWVIAIGNPFGYSHTVTVGIVSAKGRVIGAGPYDNFIQTDASINPGNSGGPLFNTNGEVVGINTAIIATGQGIGFAIPINIAKNLLPQLKKGKVVRGWLGVAIQEVTDELAEKFKLKKKCGALVTEVFKGQPAEKAGIKRGDIILAVNGKKVENSRELTMLVASLPVGKEATISVWRKGKVVNIKVKIGKRPEEKLLAKMKRAPSWEEEQQREALGMTVRDVPPDVLEALGISEEGGVQVVYVKPNGPADKAGIKPNDIIQEINQVPIKNINDYIQTLKKFESDDSLLMLILRGSESRYVVVKKKK